MGIIVLLMTNFEPNLSCFRDYLLVLWLGPRECFCNMYRNTEHTNRGLQSLRWNSWVFCNFSENCIDWSWGKFAGKIDSWVKPSHCSIMEFKLFELFSFINFLKLTCISNCFFEIIADIFPWFLLWHLTSDYEFILFTALELWTFNSCWAINVCIAHFWSVKHYKM